MGDPAPGEDPTADPRSGPAPDPASIARRSTGQVGVERIADRDEMRAIVDHVVLGARHEVCSMLPAGPYPIQVMRSSWANDVSLLRRGVSSCALYQADATQTPEMLGYLSEFARQGAAVRVTRRVSHRTIIVDRSVVMVAVEPDTLRMPYLVIREPALVRNFREQFAGVWRDAHSVGVGPEDSLDESMVREVLALLETGVTDDVAARQLGVSTRTIRRRVAAVMDLLGASSRFEAGVKAAQTGWL